MVGQRDDVRIQKSFRYNLINLELLMTGTHKIPNKTFLDRDGAEVNSIFFRPKG